MIHLQDNFSGGKMKKSLVAVLVAISLGAGTSAFADESTTASPKPKAAVNQEYKAALDKWKADSQAAQIGRAHV